MSRYKRHALLTNSEGMWVTRNITPNDNQSAVSVYKQYYKVVLFFSKNRIFTDYSNLFLTSGEFYCSRDTKDFMGISGRNKKTFQMTYIHPSSPSIHIILLVWYSYMLALKVFPSPKWCTNNTSLHTSPVFPSVLLYESRPRFLTLSLLRTFLQPSFSPKKEKRVRIKDMIYM